jgi:DNA-directed RNA polymerase subunit RPC12/RpoP
MAIEFLKESDPKKVEAWDRIHDKRKLYQCERCGAEWKCEYHENKFESKHEYNGDPDILCQCCGFPTAKEVVLREIPDILDDEEEDYLFLL